MPPAQHEQALVVLPECGERDLAASGGTEARKPSAGARDRSGCCAAPCSGARTGHNDGSGSRRAARSCSACTGACDARGRCATACCGSSACARGTSLWRADPGAERRDPRGLPDRLHDQVPRRSTRRRRSLPMLAAQFGAACAGLPLRCCRDRRRRCGFHRGCDPSRSHSSSARRNADRRSAERDQDELPRRLHGELPGRAARRARGLHVLAAQSVEAFTGLQDGARRRC